MIDKNTDLRRLFRLRPRGSSLTQLASPRSANDLLKKFAIHLILILGAIVMIIPFVWMVLTSLKTQAEATSIPVVLVPTQLRWENYKDLLNYPLMPFGNFYFNSVMMTVGRTLGQVVFCSLAAYAFARIPFPGRNALFLLFLSVLMVPVQVFILPQYLIMQHLGWLNTLQALTVPGMFSAFGTFLLRQFFMTLPMELEEAARLDGANHFQIFWRVMLPLAKPGLVALAILTTLWSWNDLLWPLIVINDADHKPLTAGLASLQGEHFTPIPLIMAGAMLAIWPMILIFILLQRQFVEGIALTGTKG